MRSATDHPARVSRWMYAALLTPIAFAVVGLTGGFSVGALCTKAPGNNGLAGGACQPG